MQPYPSYINKIKEYWQRHFSQIPYRFFIYGLIVLLILISFIAYFCHEKINKPVISPPNNAANIYDFNEKLIDMDAKLALIESNIKANNNSKNQEKLQSELEAINTQMTGLYAQTESNLEMGLDKTNSQMQKELNRVNQNVAALTHTMQPVDYLPVNQLPFIVKAIDMVGINPVVTVNYSYHTSAMEEGDSLANWELSQANFSTQTAEFVNSQHQTIKISLNKDKN